MIQLDEIGVIYNSETALIGWHVNATHRVPGWDAQRITPAAPRRVFGGIPTVFYSFASKAEFDAALATADLTAPPPVPQSLPVLQCLLALDAAGMASAYQSWAASPERTFAERAFIDRAQNWRRDDPTLTAAVQELGLTSEQLDGLFVLGATL